MKLRNWLPTKFLTEENPFIGLSFEVGYRRLAVVVGDTIIFTMSNMIRSDIDSQIYRCPPSNFYQWATGGFARGEVPVISSPVRRGFYQETGMHRYGDVVDYIGLMGNPPSHKEFTEHLLTLRRAHKSKSWTGTREDMDRLHRTMNDPWSIYRKSSSMGSGFITQQMFSRLYRENMREVEFETADHTIRKLMNNGQSGIPEEPSGHNSLTTMCRTRTAVKSFNIPKFRLTDAPGDRGPFTYVFDYAAHMACIKAVGRLGDKYYYTGEGMLPKDL